MSNETRRFGHVQDRDGVGGRTKETNVCRDSGWLEKDLHLQSPPKTADNHMITTNKVYQNTVPPYPHSHTHTE